MNEIEKTQFVRLIDVFALGPYLIYKGKRSKDNFLILIGAATILYNGHNYLQNQKKLKS